MGNVIEIQNLTKDFGNFKLENINLSLPGGTIMGLIGENGAGKSTLIKCLLGVLHPTDGWARLRGEVGYVPDECPFSDALKVQQTGQFLPGMFQSWDSGLFAHYLEKFQLPPDRKIKELSRGMKMKLTIAAALSHHPQVLVLDEPTSGLDPVVRDEILDEFLDFIQDESHGILISSHITSDLEKICDFVTYLHKGKVTISGAKDELLDRYGKVSGTPEELDQIPREILVGKRLGDYSAQALVSDRHALKRACPGLAIDPANLEDMMIFTTRGEEK